MEWLTNITKEALGAGSASAFLLAFAAGVAASFTPCTYPVLPLTVGYIGHQAGGRKARAVLLSLALVAGMALVYSVLGVIVAAIGGQMGALWGKGWFVFAVAMFFLIMSLFLLEVFQFPQSAFLGRLQGKAGARKGFMGAFVCGAVSGLIVGPCTGPILAAILGFVIAWLKASSGLAYGLQILKGGLLLFLFGFGQGALIVLCGLFAGFLSALPKSGQWLLTVKKAFALLIMLGAVLVFVYVGQATDFPDLTRFLATAGSVSEGASQTDSPQSRFGGDEFLK